jgi:hypothetical protein
MRSFIFIILFGFTAIAINAQNENKKCKYSFASTIGTAIPATTPSSTPFTWQVLGYYNLTERWAAGVGTGLSFYEKALIPLFGDVKFQIGRTRKFTPYTELGIGYSFAPENDANGGSFINPSFGIRYALKNDMKIQFAVGYELQELERLKEQTDDYYIKEFSEKLTHHSVSLKLGVIF